MAEWIPPQMKISSALVAMAECSVPWGFEVWVLGAGGLWDAGIGCWLLASSLYK